MQQHACSSSVGCHCTRPSHRSPLAGRPALPRRCPPSSAPSDFIKGHRCVAVIAQQPSRRTGGPQPNAVVLGLAPTLCSPRRNDQGRVQDWQAAPLSPSVAPPTAGTAAASRGPSCDAVPTPWPFSSSCSPTAMAGGLTIEVDDDVLVDNAGTGTLLSPGVWVQRPSRTAAAAAAPRTAAHDVEMAEAEDRCAAVPGVRSQMCAWLTALKRWQGTQLVGRFAACTGSIWATHRCTQPKHLFCFPPCRPAPSSLDMDAAAAPSEQQAAAAAPSGTPQPPAPLGRAAAAAAAGTPPRSGGPAGSPGLGGLDPDLAYLHISDDQERQEKEYLQQVGRVLARWPDDSGLWPGGSRQLSGPPADVCAPTCVLLRVACHSPMHTLVSLTIYLC